MQKQIDEEDCSNIDNRLGFRWKLEDKEFESVEKWELNSENQDPFLDCRVRNQYNRSL